MILTTLRRKASRTIDEIVMACVLAGSAVFGCGGGNEVPEDNYEPIITYPDSNPAPIKEGEAVEFDVQAVDPDGDAVTLSSGSLPTGATFDASTGKFWFIAGYDSTGSYPKTQSVTFYADDGKGGLAQKTIDVVVNEETNRPEVLYNTDEFSGGATIWHIGKMNADGTSQTMISSAGSVQEADPHVSNINDLYL